MKQLSKVLVLTFTIMPLAYGICSLGSTAWSQIGTIKWTFQAGGPVKSSPAIGSDGTIYVGSNAAKVYAINPNGTKKWDFPTGG